MRIKITKPGTFSTDEGKNVGFNRNSTLTVLEEKHNGVEARSHTKQCTVFVPKEFYKYITDIAPVLVHESELPAGRHGVSDDVWKHIRKISNPAEELPPGHSMHKPTEQEVLEQMLTACDRLQARLLERQSMLTEDKFPIARRELLGGIFCLIELLDDHAETLEDIDHAEV